MTQPHPTHVVLAGGGTGGHLFPGLALAQRLRCDRPEVRITFVGSGKPLERKHVERAGSAYRALPCRPLPRRPWHLPAFLVENLAGYRAAKRLLREEDVDAVVGLGGYVSVPTARVAVALDLPLILLEQNAVPGRATRWLATSATAVCTAFESAAGRLPAGCRVHLVGTPVRTESIISPPSATTSEPQRLLILGGSSGSQSLNRHVPRALARVRFLLDTWQIVHQSGPRHEDSTRRLYETLQLPATVTPFLDDMPRTLPGIDLAICRAGGATLAELACASVPAILLPYPHATDDHQRKNAEYHTAAGACLMLDERRTPGRLDIRLAEALSDLLPSSIRRQQMATAMRRIAHPMAADQVANLLGTLLPARDVALPKAA